MQVQRRSLHWTEGNEPAYLLIIMDDSYIVVQLYSSGSIYVDTANIN